ncbi:WD domain, G-beta repeat-containing protein [Frankia sp. EI5c]|nr:WD domain, G-beta repeat-containing protein [Frankia sp. EI5c]
MIIDRDRVAAILPEYSLGAELGSGAFGLVLAGEHRQLGHRVAIKVMKSAEPDGLTGDFLTEGATLASLDHPHVVRAFDYREADGLCLIVMELLAGGTLTRRRRGMTPQQGCAVGLAVAAALDHAHNRKVLHRDIKADNILFAGNGTVKVTDFGIAKMFEGSAATASGIAGTPLYMAPEQIEGGRLSSATDLYALAIALYQVFAGAPPFDPKQPLHALLRQHLTSPPPPLAMVPPGLAQVILRALAKDPADRQADAHTFATELATAATAAYGPGWADSDHTGQLLHLTDPIRRALQPPSPPATPVTGKNNPKINPPVVPISPPAVTHVPPTPSHPPSYRRARIIAGAATLAFLLLAVLLLITLPNQPDDRLDSPPPLSTAQALGQPLRNEAYPVNSVAYSPDGHTLATGSAHHRLRLWDVRDPTHPTLLGQSPTGHANWVNSVAYSPDGHTLATGSDDRTVLLWDVRDPTHPTPLGQPLTSQTGAVLSVAFSPDGSLLATGSADNTVRLWDLDDPTHPTLLDKPLTGHLDKVLSVAFSPDGNLLATGSADNTARLWSVHNPANPTPYSEPLTGHVSPVRSVAFSPDGRTLATGSDDRTVLLWNIDDLGFSTPVAHSLTGHLALVLSVAFSPDGRTLATGSGDNTVRLWELQ